MSQTTKLKPLSNPMIDNTYTPHEDPPRPSREELATMLTALATGQDAPMVNQSPHDIGWGHQGVRLASGWRLRVWWLVTGMGPMSGAMAPDGRRWDYGCDRWPDWDAGATAIVLDPLRHLVPSEYREMIAERLRVAPVVEVPKIEYPPVNIAEIWTEQELMDMGGG